MFEAILYLGVFLIYFGETAFGAHFDAILSPSRTLSGGFPPPREHNFHFPLLLERYPKRFDLGVSLEASGHGVCDFGVILLLK